MSFLLLSLNKEGVDDHDVYSQIALFKPLRLRGSFADRRPIDLTAELDRNVRVVLAFAAQSHRYYY